MGLVLLWKYGRIKYNNYTAQHTQKQTYVSVFNYGLTNQSVTCQAQSGNRSPTGNMFQLPPVTPRLFNRPRTQQDSPNGTSAPFIPTFIHSPKPAMLSMATLKRTVLYLVGSVGQGGSALFKCISAQTCWDLMDEVAYSGALCVKFCVVKEDIDSD